MAGIMGLFASELDEFVADYDNQFWDASFHGETYPPRIIMERSTPPLYRVEDDGTKTLDQQKGLHQTDKPRRRAAGAVPARLYAGTKGNGGGAE
ncbi:MAG: hypothetical protein ACLR5X_16280 [Oscillospiraceae bacterium]